ncbi:hypothetical protein C7212DRAFT_340076 [Tuber magnatum]|uniref:Uncharacterized protein n=1 Tax=Tuber magnatum TaxID=42249 RepID=A0A317SXD5_9PEZI|nr:hypothetical protein C7212DRAFT_340076 [Tuber magnatum]
MRSPTPMRKNAWPVFGKSPPKRSSRPSLSPTPNAHPHSHRGLRGALVGFCIAELEDSERGFDGQVWGAIVDLGREKEEGCWEEGAGVVRDAKMVKDGVGYGVSVEVVHDLCVVLPGELVTKRKGSPFAAYTPWFKAWVENIHSCPSELELYPPPPEWNPNSFREAHASLFGSPIPSAPRGKALEGEEQVEYLASLCPDGEHATQERLEKLLKDQVEGYHEDKDNLADGGTSMLSVHLISGTLPARLAGSECCAGCELRQGFGSGE